MAHLRVQNFFLPFVILRWLILTVADQDPTFFGVANQYPAQHCVSKRGNYTDNSTYPADLGFLLTSFSNTTVEFGFYNSSAGGVKAMGLCRGDLTPDACRTCIESCSHDIRRLCPNFREAVIYQETCTLRYSDRSIFGIWEADPMTVLDGLRNFSDVNGRKLLMRKLLSPLYKEAASGGSLRKYALGETALGFETVYALVQCTPDLDAKKCRDCLVYLHSTIPFYVQNVSSVHIAGPSCNIRYDSYRFYPSPSDGPSSSPSLSPSPTPKPNDTSGNGKKKRIIIAVSVVASLVLVFCICIFIFWKVRKPKEQVENVDEIISLESLRFDFESIKVATNNFSDANKLGQGGFGDVYKGKLPNGQDIVVKRLSKDSRQGETEFKNEVSLVAKLQHRNLVRFLGFCLEGIEKVLIYEFVPNANLDQFIFDPVKSSQLTWERRYKIIEGIARGLVYLHEDSRVQIIHRDLRASNILLDDELNPKISDFGMARMFMADQTQDKTSTRIFGSPGYKAPEYATSGKFSSKSDVYSFGVLTLEITSGQQNNYSQNGEDAEDLLNYAWKSWSEDTMSDFVDPVLIRPGVRNEMITRCIQIALLCLQENVVDRPSMTSVILMLNSDSLPLPVPSKPSLPLHLSIEQEACSY